MERKTTLWIFQATNQENCIRNYSDMALKDDPVERKRIFFDDRKKQFQKNLLYQRKN